MSDSNTKTRKLNRGIVSAIVFALIFIFGITSLTYILRYDGDTKTRFMGFYAEPKNSLDIVMIGSSPTYSSCVFPELYGEYGIKAYPLASNVQRPVAGKYLVKEALKTQTPALFMFEMRMYVGEQLGLTGNLAYTREVTDNLKYSFNRIDLINAMVTDDIVSFDGEKYTYYFDIFKYHSNWYSLIRPGQYRAWRYTYPDPGKGYKITDKVGPIPTPDAPHAEDAVELESYQEEALESLLAYLKETGSDALFYVAPYELKPGDAAKYGHIRDVVTAAGYDFLDMNEYYNELELDFERDFSDYGIHTNAVGAKKCTQFLGEYLRTHYDLPDHRLDPGLDPARIKGYDSSWDKAYSDWLVEYDEAEAGIDKHIAEHDFFVLEE